MKKFPSKMKKNQEIHLNNEEKLRNLPQEFTTKVKANQSVKSKANQESHQNLQETPLEVASPTVLTFFYNILAESSFETIRN